MKIQYKNKIFRVAALSKLGLKFSIPGFWESPDGTIPENSHIVHLLLEEREFKRL